MGSGVGPTSWNVALFRGEGEERHEAPPAAAALLGHKGFSVLPGEFRKVGVCPQPSPCVLWGVCCVTKNLQKKKHEMGS